MKGEKRSSTRKTGEYFRSTFLGDLAEKEEKRGWVLQLVGCNKGGSKGILKENRGRDLGREKSWKWEGEEKDLNLEAVGLRSIQKVVPRLG